LTTTTSQQGRFRFAAIPAGVYNVEAADKLTRSTAASLTITDTVKIELTLVSR
jgi:hypothetical protein